MLPVAVQESVAEAVPKAVLIAALEGLHPMFPVEPPESVIVGPTVSVVHETVLLVVAEFPQRSVAVHVRVLELEHPTVVTTLSVEVMVIFPEELHLSVADAVPKAALICTLVGLQAVMLAVYPVMVIVGPEVSEVQVALRLMGTADRPQAFVAVQIRVLVVVHPETTSESL